MDGSSAKLNKTIVILTPGFASNEDDTTCIPALQDYVAELHQNHPELKLFVLSFQYPFRKGWYQWKGIDVYSADGRNSKYIFKLRTWFRIYRQLKRIHKEYDIHTIHSFWLTEAPLVAQYFTTSKSIKHIATLFGQDALASNKYLRLLNFNKFTLVGNSEFVSQRLQATNGRKVNHIIHFGLSQNIIDHKLFSTRPYDIVGVGSLIKLKNYELFARLIGDVKKDFPFIKAIIVGEGVERENLEKLISELNLPDNVTLVGNVPRQEVIELMSRSKILLHTSLYESAGYVFLEALSSGCQIVSFGVGYAPPCEKVHRPKEAAGMVAIIKSLLNSDMDFGKHPVPTMRETVQKFVHLYLE